MKWNNLLEMWREEKKKRIETEKKLNKLLDELTELNTSWEKYNETRNKLKKKEEQVLLDTFCKGK
jgi:chromosome segregation ATPase